MTNSSPRSVPFRGIVVPLATPVTAPDQLDVPGLERLVDRMITGGVHALFILGSCGEGPSLTPATQREVIDRVCRQTAGRIPVLVGVSDASTVETTSLARHGADAGADAIVIAPPFYYPLNQEELYAYASHQAAESPLPTVVYNMPQLTKLWFELETVKRLFDNPRIVGLKDSSGDMTYFRAAREATRGRDDWSVLIGGEHLLAQAVAIGGDGGVTGGANIFPELFVQLYEAARAGFDDETAAFESAVASLGRVYAVGADGPITASSVIKGLKGGLAALGVCSGLPNPPLAPLTAAQLEEVKQIVHEVNAHHGAALTAAQQQ